MLPPEIRDRIYDYVFEDLIVRVDRGLGPRKRYREAPACNVVQMCDEHWRQPHPERILHRSFSDPFYLSESHKNCDKHSRQEIPVHLLQVCRKIYHEAALKPFTSNLRNCHVYSGPRLGKIPSFLGS